MNRRQLHATPLRKWRAQPEATTYRSLATRVGATERHILRIAAGHSCSRELAVEIRSATGISLDDLLGNALPPEPKTEAARRAVDILGVHSRRHRARRVDL